MEQNTNFKSHLFPNDGGSPVICSSGGAAFGSLALPATRIGSRFEEFKSVATADVVMSPSIQSETTTPASVSGDSVEGLSEEQKTTLAHIKRNWDTLAITIPNALVAFYSSLIWDGYWDCNPVEEFGDPAPRLTSGVFLEEWVRPECIYPYADRSFGMEIRPAWSQKTIGLRVSGVGVIVCPADVARTESYLSVEVQAYLRRTLSWSYDKGSRSEKARINPLQKSGQRWFCDVSLPRVTTVDGWAASLIERSTESHRLPIKLGDKVPSASQEETAAWLVASSPTLFWNVSKAVCNWFLSSAWKPYWAPRPDESLLAPGTMLDHIKVEQVYLGRSEKCIEMKLSMSGSDQRIGVIARPGSTHVGGDVILS